VLCTKYPMVNVGYVQTRRLVVVIMGCVQTNPNYLW